MVNDPGEFEAVTVAEGQVYTAAPFIRCTDTGGCTLIAKSL
jgi:hypothetical protein